jgi:hypothetical protein
VYGIAQGYEDTSVFEDRHEAPPSQVINVANVLKQASSININILDEYSHDYTLTEGKSHEPGKQCLKKKKIIN